MADYYTLLTNAGIAYETACKAAGVPIKLTQMSVGDGNGAVYNPAATATELKREVWRGPLNALFQDESNPSWLLAEVTIPPEVGGWYVREAGLWTDTGILYAIVKYPESFKPVLATSGSGKEFYIRSIFETSNAAQVTLLIDDTVVKATRSWVSSYVADELAKLDFKQSVRAATTENVVLSGAQSVDGVAIVAGQRVLVKNQTLASQNGIWVAATGAWVRAKDADLSAEVTPAMIVAVEEGATQADTIWKLVTDGQIVLGTTALAFVDITAGYAPLASPTFVGVPKAPTAAKDTATKQLATTEFVLAQASDVSPKVNGVAAPGVSGRYSREDHVHPVDSTRAALTDLPYRGHLVWSVAGVYSWTVPQGVTKAYVVVKGGGGSGRNSQLFGPGGGGGGVAEGLVVLVPGTVITITVGAGGAGVAYTVSGSPGLPGGGSSFGGFMSASGGGGGDSSGGGGKSGVGTGGDLNYGLGDGQTAGRTANSTYGFPGSGGGPGGAGSAVDSSNVGQSPLRNGQGPGGGGGGRMDNGGFSGAGAAGSVSVRW